MWHARRWLREGFQSFQCSIINCVARDCSRTSPNPLQLLGQSNQNYLIMITKLRGAILILEDISPSSLAGSRSTRPRSRRREAADSTTGGTTPTNLARIFSLASPGGEGRGEEVLSLAGGFLQQVEFRRLTAAATGLRSFG